MKCYKILKYSEKKIKKEKGGQKKKEKKEAKAENKS